jgi:putative oxidoreductase
MNDYKGFLLGSTPSATLADGGLLILRVFAGLALALAHGLGKVPPSERFVGWIGGMGFPAPEFFAWASGFAEFFCGMLLVVGLLTRPASVFIVINMTVAVLFGHAGQGFGEREKALLFGVIALTFFIVGPGRYSVDAWLRRRRAGGEVAGGVDAGGA